MYTKKQKIPKNVLITGSAGLVGSEAVKFFCNLDSKVYGIDNDLRSYFFGPTATTQYTRKRIIAAYKNYHHFNLDIRDKEKVSKLFKKVSFDLIIHAAAQPSHDWAAKEPITDFSVNALATLELLENTRKYSPEAVFIFMSTNKVYGDNPNRMPVKELETRWDLPKNHQSYSGIDETMSIDNSIHSIFGVSKASADLMVQEYGRYFKMKTGCFRGGCITGSGHAGAELHGFLSYLIRSVARGDKYNIYGYNGKQVRDNIHAYDLVNAFWHFYQNPGEGEVYNIGGTRKSNISVSEALTKAEKILKKKAITKYIDQPRMGDHIWYISDMKKFKSHYPEWKITYSIDSIFEDIAKNVNK